MFNFLLKANITERLMIKKIVHVGKNKHPNVYIRMGKKRRLFLKVHKISFKYFLRILYHKNYDQNNITVTDGFRKTHCHFSRNEDKSNFSLTEWITFMKRPCL